ncbi:hypothetical protein [Bradyrhizobium sp.]
MIQTTMRYCNIERRAPSLRMLALRMSREVIAALVDEATPPDVKRMRNPMVTSAA